MLAICSSFSLLNRRRLMANKHLVFMESGGFFYVLFFLSILSLLGISTCSSHHQNIYCNNATDCRMNVSSVSDFSVCCYNICRSEEDCRLNSSSDTISSSSKSSNSIKDSSEKTGSSSNRIRNNTRPVTTSPANATYNFNQSLSCFKDSDCVSTKICLSFDCLTKSPNEKIKDCQRCESIDCKDGSCYNLTILVLPTESASEGTITTLQLVLLFGSMGGIFIFIIIVYCVKTFTDNRQRQYLLKHGVWENPPNKEGKEKEEKDADAKSDASRQQRKLEVPTITVETETDCKRKKKQKGNLKDEVTDTEGLEEFAVQQESKNHKVTDPGQRTTTQHVNHSTKNPYSVQTKIGQTIESPQNVRLPTGWDNKDESTPLTESPRQKRFGNLKKPKPDSSPTKIIANGTPEKSSKFGKQNSSSVQLCEPENFSDFGM